MHRSNGQSTSTLADILHFNANLPELAFPRYQEGGREGHSCASILASGLSGKYHFLYNSLWSTLVIDNHNNIKIAVVDNIPVLQLRL